MTTRLNIAKSTMAPAGYKPIRAIRCQAVSMLAPRLDSAQTAEMSAATVIGHASYRVRHASVNTIPTLAVPAFEGPSSFAWLSTTEDTEGTLRFVPVLFGETCSSPQYSISSATPSVVRATNSG